MRKIALAALASGVAVAALPAAAATDCDGGFNTHMTKMSTYVTRVPATDLASAVQQSLNAYNSCKAGDSFSPRGVWDQIAADMEAKVGK